jgi:hypothetical protein
MRRGPKKTESIEVRLPDETKQAFMKACERRSTSASAVLRSFIERYVRSASRAPIHWNEELQMLLTGTSMRTRAAAGAIVATFAAGVVAVSIATPARAATDPLLAAVYQWMDTNHDGKLSAAEFLSPRSDEPFGAIGVVVDTKTRPANETPKALFARLDANHDGSISLGELSAQALARTVLTPAITAADANRDGEVSESELAAYIAAQRAAAGLRDPSGGAALMAHGIIAGHDRRGTGSVSLADLKQGT